MFHSATEHVDLSAPFRQQSGASIRPTKFGRALEAQVLSFFLELTVEQRLTRFGTPSSDWAIREWRSKIDRSYYQTVTCERGRQLVGLVELFGSAGTGWRRPELALVVRPASDTSSLCRHLLSIGLTAALEMGAVDVLMCFNTIDAHEKALALQSGGTLDHDSGIAIIPCYAVPTDGLGCWHSSIDGRFLSAPPDARA
jgi:hypothetical protein